MRSGVVALWYVLLALAFATMVGILTIFTILPVRAQQQQPSPAQLANGINQAVIGMAQQIERLQQENEQLKKELKEKPDAEHK